MYDGRSTTSLSTATGPADSWRRSAGARDLALAHAVVAMSPARPRSFRKHHTPRALFVLVMHHIIDREQTYSGQTEALKALTSHTLANSAAFATQDAPIDASRMKFHH